MGKVRGFTLIEVIVTLVLVALLGTAVYSFFFSDAFMESMAPISRLQTTGELHTVMENISARYAAAGSASSFLNDLYSRGTGASSLAGTDYLSGVSGGPYQLVENLWIAFDVNNNQIPDPGGLYFQRMLKITVQDNLGQTLSTIFTVP
ncbi:MAG: prepilin-type N-terminal cleavage/methylation domain-containing protein [Thermodesulfobacteriota bacterium]